MRAPARFLLGLGLAAAPGTSLAAATHRPAGVQVAEAAETPDAGATRGYLRVIE